MKEKKTGGEKKRKRRRLIKEKVEDVEIESRWQVGEKAASR
jgi:hypothetical protein